MPLSHEQHKQFEEEFFSKLKQGHYVIAKTKLAAWSPAQSGTLPRSLFRTGEVASPTTYRATAGTTE